jgi:hypothetical protein
VLGIIDRLLVMQSLGLCCAAMPPSPRIAHGVLAIVLLLAACVRLWNCDFNIGNGFVPDATEKVEQARAVASGDLIPHNWVQPYFLPYTGGAFLAVAGRFADLDQAQAERVLTRYMIALAVATIALTYAMGALIFGRSVGLIGAAILAAVPANVMGARYIKEDIPVMFLSNLAFLAIVFLIQKGGRRHHLLAGLAVGLAIGAKFSAAVLVPVLVAALFMRAHEHKPISANQVRWMLASILLIPVGFLVVNPFDLLQVGRFISGIRYQTAYSSSGHFDGTMFRPWPSLWTFYLQHALWPGLTTLPLLAALIGMPLVVAANRERRNPCALLLVGWIALDYLIFEASPAKPFPFFVRYLHPIFPPLACLAARSIYRARDGLARIVPKGAVMPTWSIVIFALLLWPAAKSTLITAAMADDTRLQAGRYMDANIPPATKIGFESRHYSPRPDPRRLTIDYELNLAWTPLSALEAKGIRFVAFDSFRTDRYEVPGGAPIHEQIRRNYASLRRRCTSITEFAPRFRFETYGFQNPRLFLCQLPSRLRGVPGAPPPRW